MAQWKLAGETIDLGRGALLMGVLNVTPDSFSDGGQFFDLDAAVEQASRMLADGADIIDVGGESTRPGAAEVEDEEELRRVLPVIERVKSAHPAARISIDTSKARVARAALEAGAVIVNDVTGGRADPAMHRVVAESGAGFIVMHMQGTPRTMQNAPHYENVVEEVRDFFRQEYTRALECGIDSMALAFDPGIGFGKTLQHNLALLRNLARLRVEERPLVVGVSRKSFLGKITGTNEITDRVTPTVALTALLRAQGADVLRVHDVKENAAALRTAEAVLEAGS